MNDITHSIDHAAIARAFAAKVQSLFLAPLPTLDDVCSRCYREHDGPSKACNACMASSDAAWAIVVAGSQRGHIARDQDAYDLYMEQRDYR